MSKTTATRTSLVNELNDIRTAREAEEKSFKAALEKLYADHRKAMAELKTRRENAWKTFSAAADALAKAAKKPAKKSAKKRPAKKSSAKKSRPVTLTTVAHANEVSDPSVLLP